MLPEATWLISIFSVAAVWIWGAKIHQGTERQDTVPDKWTGEAEKDS